MVGQGIGGRLRITVLLAAAAWPTESTAVAAPLRVTHARLDRDTPHSGNSGRVVIKGRLDTTTSGVDVAAALLANTAVANVRDAGQIDLTRLIVNCVRAGSGIRCKSGNFQLKLKPTASASVYRIQLVGRQLNSAGAGTAQPQAPVRVSLSFPGAADVVDVISDCAPIGESRLGCRDRNRPNVVFIVTDDQRWDTLQYMPTVLDRIASRGVTFSNAFVTTPSCAASRASMLTGQYARHHGVRTVAFPNGGALKFVGPDQSTLATWLHDAGYRTGMYGKYLTDYHRQCPPATARCYIPPGWDEWHVFVQQHYFNYRLAENDTVTTFGAAPADYATDVISAKAVEFIMTAEGQPFFLHVAFNAPHQEGNIDPIPAPRHAGMYNGIELWRPPAYDEPDITDKPSWFAFLPRAGTLLSIITWGIWGDTIRQRQIETLPAVDEAVDALMDALEATGQADNTMVVFTSDNGHLWGEHRYFYGKGPIQEESIRVPLVMRFPPLVSAGTSDPRMALNIDLPVTLARVAGVTPPESVDGSDLRPLFADASAVGRQDFVVEMSSPIAANDYPDYAGIRTDSWKYVPYPSEETAELYDLINDPYELDNRALDPAYQETVTALQARLDALLAEP